MNELNLPIIDFEQSEIIGQKMAELNFVFESTPPDFNSPKSLDDLGELSMMSATFKVLELKAEVDLGEIKIFLKVEGSSKPIDSTLLQIYIKREYLDFQGNPMVKWELVQPKTEKANMAFSIYANDSQTFTLNEKLPIGKYSEARVIFFADGWQLLADQMAKVTPFEIITTQIRIKKPILEILEDQVRIVDKKILIPFVLKFPPTSRPPWNSWWAMAKGYGPGGGLFQQKWLNFGNLVNGVMERTEICKEATGPDKYWYVESTFELPEPEVAGLYNVQYGVFDNNWKETYHWIWPGTDIEVGGSVWVAKCPQEKLPPRLRVKDGKFVKLDGTSYNFYEGTKGADAISTVRGASWGNAYIWTREPAFNRSGYFSSLRYIGHRICRFVFDPDQYTSSKVYRNRILDSINKILIGGMYPLCGPHHLHMQVSSPAERDKKFLEMCEMIANDWKGLPIIYAIASEPKELTGGWPECKALWEKAAKLIRAIDPDMFILVPTSGYSKLSTLPESKDLLDRNLVDAYSYHPYNAASDVIPFMKPLLDSGVGIIIEEYGCGNVTWQKSINIEMQKISKQYPNLLSIMTWAWTKYGQDACPMVENGDLANITLTDVGKMQALDIAIWDSGKFIDESGDITPPSVDNEGNVNGGGSTGTSGGGTGTSTTVDLTKYYTKTEIDQKFTNLPKIYNATEIQAIVKASETDNSLSEADIRKITNEELSDKNLLSPDFEYRVSNTVNLFNYATIPVVDSMIKSNLQTHTSGVSFVEMQNYINAVFNLKLLSISLSPATINSGAQSTGTLKLTGLAPKGGVLVNVVSNNPNIIVPSVVTVDENSDTATFNIKTIPVNVKTVGTITATNGGVSRGTNLTINAPVITAFTFSPSPTSVGRQTTGTLKLSGLTASGSNSITITSSVPVNEFPMNVSLLPSVNETQFTFTPTIGGNITVTFTASFNGVNRSTNLRIA